MQSRSSQQVDGERISIRLTEPPAGVERVRVWFGTHVVADYVADPLAAARYAAAMRRRFAGLRVTNDHMGSATAAEKLAARPLPSERLWELTP